MPAAERVQRVRIYLSRDDQWEGRSRYLALMDRLRNIGATGATALQGLGGFGPSQRIRAGMIEHTDQHLPVVIEWLDHADRVTRLLPLLDELIGQNLTTVEDVPVYRAILRDSGPFAADHTVGDTMRTPAPCAPADASLADAVNLLAEHQITALPIIASDSSLAGLLSEQELTWRVGLRLPIALIRQLTPAERGQVLASLAGYTLREVMSIEPRSVVLSTSLSQALVTMVEWGYAHIPVIDRDGRLAGIIGQEDVLNVVVKQAAPSDGPISSIDPPISVGLVMQTITPQLTLGMPMSIALDQILAAPARRILIADSAGRLRGTIDLASTLTILPAEERAALITALQQPRPEPTSIGARQTLDALVSSDILTLTPEVPITQAARRLLDLGAESMPVVDGDGRLLGIIARGGLIRALLQQSE